SSLPTIAVGLEFPWERRCARSEYETHRTHFVCSRLHVARCLGVDHRTQGIVAPTAVARVGVNGVLHCGGRGGSNPHSGLASLSAKNVALRPVLFFVPCARGRLRHKFFDAYRRDGWRIYKNLPFSHALPSVRSNER